MTPAAVTNVREGFRTVTPYVTVTDGARLIDFLQRTFGSRRTAAGSLAGRLPRRGADW